MTRKILVFRINRLLSWDLSADAMYTEKFTLLGYDFVD